jgi:hypothetical protein
VSYVFLSFYLIIHIFCALHIPCAFLVFDFPSKIYLFFPSSLFRYFIEVEKKFLNILWNDLNISRASGKKNKARLKVKWNARFIYFQTLKDFFFIAIRLSTLHVSVNASCPFYKNELQTVKTISMNKIGISILLIFSFSY